uniref:Uncharacterized protein n=1 Tax=Helianthus annuus TaxID=4232 RepID=A0A251SE25_HELAN
MPGSLKSLQTGSLDVHQGDFIPMQTIASTGPSVVPESQQYGFPNLNPMGVAVTLLIILLPLTMDSCRIQVSIMLWPENYKN